jgi:hypothetical protein
LSRSSLLHLQPQYAQLKIHLLAKNIFGILAGAFFALISPEQIRAVFSASKSLETSK